MRQRDPEERDRLMRERLAAARAALAARAAAAPPSGDPHAIRAAPAAPPVGRTIARLVPGGPVENPKIHEADLRAVRAPGWNGMLERTRARARAARALGDPFTNHIAAVSGMIARAARDQGSGFARLSYAAIAKGTDLSTGTVRRCVRWLEAHDLIDTLNVMGRATVDGVRRIVRTANAYLPVPALDEAADVPAAEAAPAADSRQPLAPAARAAATLARWASAFGLAVRPQGFNRPAPRPAPA